MIGAFIVYEGVFRDRFRVRQIIGETAAFWKVRSTKTLDTERIKKGSVGPCAFFDTEQEAVKVASRYTDKMIKARKHFIDRRGAILSDLQKKTVAPKEPKDG